MCRCAPALVLNAQKSAIRVADIPIQAAGRERVLTGAAADIEEMYSAGNVSMSEPVLVVGILEACTTRWITRSS